MLDEELIRFLARGDAAVEKAARNIGRVLDSLELAFEAQKTNDVHSCRAKISVRDHIVAHATMLHWLMLVRLRENLTDFVAGLRNRRVLAAALAGRAAMETGAATV